MNFRIDPIDEKGVFDHDFYASEDYQKYVDKLLLYLNIEGFEAKEEEFHIKFLDHDWLCRPPHLKPKKK